MTTIPEKLEKADEHLGVFLKNDPYNLVKNKETKNYYDILCYLHKVKDARSRTPKIILNLYALYRKSEKEIGDLILEYKEIFHEANNHKYVNLFDDLFILYHRETHFGESEIAKLTYNYISQMYLCVT